MHVRGDLRQHLCQQRRSSWLSTVHSEPHRAPAAAQTAPECHIPLQSKTEQHIPMSAVCCVQSQKGARRLIYHVSRGQFLSDGFGLLSWHVHVLHAHVSKKKKKKRLEEISRALFVLLHLRWKVMLVWLCGSLWALHSVGTQVQSSSSVLILRVLTVSIESSWQLKEERKIGKWGGVSMLRPLPPHSSLAEDVWIYSGNATFERNKWDGCSSLLCVWMPSSGVSLSDTVQHKAKEGEL